MYIAYFSFADILVQNYTMKRTTIILITFCFLSQLAVAQNPSISGNLWIDLDQNNMYDGEDGIDGVKMYLKDFDSDEIIDSATTLLNTYTFPSSAEIVLAPGDYYIEIPIYEFNIGGNLQGVISCSGGNFANDGVDNDDNGMVNVTSVITLETTDINYVDFCFNLFCTSANPLASNSCDNVEANIICDIQILGTFCNILPSFLASGDQPSPLCSDSGEAENISWFGFVAFAGNYEIVLNPLYCEEGTNGTRGIEMGIYNDCSFSEAIFCSSTCTLDPIVVESSALVPGEIYYMFIDGCEGSICTYSIDINGAPVTASFNPDDLCLVENEILVCENTEINQFTPVTFEVVAGIGADIEYYWDINTISGADFNGPLNYVTTENTIDILFETLGEYEICLTNLGNECNSWSGSLCINVTVIEIDTFGIPACEQITIEDIVCGASELNNIIGLMSTETSSGNQPNPTLCPSGGVANNISWFAFIADEGDYSITVTPTNCSGSTTGLEGVQMGLYTDCTFTESIFCEPDCSTNPISVFSDGSGIGQTGPLIPGQTYYFFVDGCNDSVCSYEISVDGNPIPVSVDVEEICFMQENATVCDDALLCPNDTITFQVTTNNQNNQGEVYDWQINTLSGGPFTGNATPQSENGQLDVAFENEGTYSLCLTGIEHFCFTNWEGNVCRSITIDEEKCIECDEDIVSPIIQGVSLSTAVLNNTNQVKIYARDFIIFAQDNCSPQSSLIYSFNAQGPAFDEYYDETVSSAFRYLDCCNVVNSPENIELFVFDEAGNVSGISATLTVIPPVGQDCEGCTEDNVAPNLQTIIEPTLTFPKDSSEIKIFASFFVDSADDNCTGSSNIKYSFTPTSPYENAEAEYMVFLCEDVQSSPFELDIYAWDKNANFTFASSTLILEPEEGLDCSEMFEEITGGIYDLDNTPLEGAKVFLETATGDVIESVTTDADGTYSFLANPSNRFLRVEYESSNAQVITVMDLMRMQQYLLGLMQFSTPQILASDINADNKIRVNDLQLLRSIILGMVEQSEYLDNSWKFSTFDGDLVPIQNNRFRIEQTDMPDLVGYRVGDVD